MHDTKIQFAYIDGKQIQYRILNKLVHDPYLKCKGKEIFLITSKKHEQEAIHNYVPLHINRFYKYLQWDNERKPIDTEMKKLKILGRHYGIKLISMKGQKKYEIVGGVIYVNNKFKLDYVIRNIYIDIITPYVTKRTKYWQIKMGLTKHRIDIQFAWMKRCLGLCYCENNGIRPIKFASRLFAYDKEQIDCTIVHELAHIVHFHHQKPFWDLVIKYIPNYYSLHSKIC